MDVVGFLKPINITCLTGTGLKDDFSPFQISNIQKAVQALRLSN